MYLMTHPGTPSVFYDHLEDPQLGTAVQRLVALRLRAGIHCRSKVSSPCRAIPKWPGALDGAAAKPQGMEVDMEKPSEAPRGYIAIFVPAAVPQGKWCRNRPSYHALDALEGSWAPCCAGDHPQSRVRHVPGHCGQQSPHEDWPQGSSAGCLMDACRVWPLLGNLGQALGTCHCKLVWGSESFDARQRMHYGSAYLIPEQCLQCSCTQAVRRCYICL